MGLESLRTQEMVSADSKLAVVFLPAAIKFHKRGFLSEPAVGCQTWLSKTLKSQNLGPCPSDSFDSLGQFVPMFHVLGSRHREET